MKLPRISVNSVMIVVFAAAFDCMAMRSVHIRPGVNSGLVDVILLGTLPMANILAVGLTLLAWRRGEARRFWAGFVASGSAAVLVTALGLKSALAYLESALASTALGDWLAASEIGGLVTGYVVIPGLLFLFQMLVAMAGGALARKIVPLADAASALVPSRRLQFGGLLMMTALIAVPALVIEGTLRWKIDPMTTRQGVGTKAVVDVKVIDGWRVTLKDGSNFLLPNGSEVRIDDDSQPSTFAGVKSSKGEQFGDHRSVRVTLLGGECAGEPTSVPRQFLRAIR